MSACKSLPLLFAYSLFFKERLEWFAPVALYKRATVSDSLRPLYDKRAMGGICSFSQANRSFTHKKRANCLKKPMSKFPTLLLSHHMKSDLARIVTGWLRAFTRILKILEFCLLSHHMKSDLARVVKGWLRAFTKLLRILEFSLLSHHANSDLARVGTG